MIGTNAPGSAAIANQTGVVFGSATTSNLLGTSGQDGAASDALERNVVSGNTNGGVLVRGAGATGNVVAGNFIGTNAAGTSALANAGNGVDIFGAATTGWA